MKNVRVKVRGFTCGNFDFGIYKRRKLLMINPIGIWTNRETAVKHAKARAKQIGISFDNEIVKMHGC